MRYFFCGSFMFLFCLVFAMFCARLFICALWSPAGKGLTSWLSFVVSSVSLSLSHWYPGSGVVLDCIDSWSLQPYYFALLEWLANDVEITPKKSKITSLSLVWIVKQWVNWYIEYQVSVFWYQVYQARLWECMLNRSASLAMSTSVLKALHGKLDIKIHSPSILCIRHCEVECWLIWQNITIFVKPYLKKNTVNTQIFA